MIRSLSVRNLATLESVSVEFEAGLTVLTGETGAGKSLLIDAIGLALGHRADSTLVRTGCPRAQVALEIELGPALAATLKEQGLPVREGINQIERDVSAEGRSQAKLNGQPVTAGQLKALAERTVEMHGQHDHHALLDPERQIAFLDEWIGEECATAKGRMREAYDRWAELESRLRHAGASARDRAQRLDLLRYQRDEIREAQVVVGEWDELDARLRRLQHAQRIGEAVAVAREALRHGEVTAGSLTGKALRELQSIVAYDDRLSEIVEQLGEAEILLDEAGMALAQYAETLDNDPAEQEQAEERRRRLRDLFRKYGEDEAAVLDHLAAAEREIATLESLDEDNDCLVAAKEEAERVRDEAAAVLSDVRRRYAPRFAEIVTETLLDLALPDARFVVRCEQAAVSADGADAVTFDFTANLGEDPKSLHKVASGGEMARVMLAIKAASAGRAGTPTIIFDEVDTGLSGRAAALVARQLERLGQHSQVLVISHLPQMAARATHHARIVKTVTAGRVATHIHRLQGEERVDEVARLLAGEDLTEEARANARAMIEGSPGRDSNSHGRKAKGF